MKRRDFLRSAALIIGTAIGGMGCLGFGKIQTEESESPEVDITPDSK